MVRKLPKIGEIFKGDHNAAVARKLKQKKKAPFQGRLITRLSHINNCTANQVPVMYSLGDTLYTIKCFHITQKKSTYMHEWAILPAKYFCFNQARLTILSQKQ